MVDRGRAATPRPQRLSALGRRRCCWTRGISFDRHPPRDPSRAAGHAHHWQHPGMPFVQNFIICHGHTEVLPPPLSDASVRSIGERGFHVQHLSHCSLADKVGGVRGQQVVAHRIGGTTKLLSSEKSDCAFETSPCIPSFPPLPERRLITRAFSESCCSLQGRGEPALV